MSGGTETLELNSEIDLALETDPSTICTTLELVSEITIDLNLESEISG